MIASDIPMIVKPASGYFSRSSIRSRVSSPYAISWFFENVEAGIILEDDCVPEPTFFQFCNELLERYKDEKRILIIRGDNYHPKILNYEYSYYFSTSHGSWGWATWRRAWQHYDEKMEHWPKLRKTSWLLNILGNSTSENEWKKNFDNVYEGKIDTWDYQWVFSCWVNGGLSVVPLINMITNIGHDERATHTKNSHNPLSNLPTQDMKFPLNHPPSISHDIDIDQVEYQISSHRLNFLRILRKLYRKLFDL